MPVNFGQLAQIGAPQVVANLSSYPVQPDQSSQLINGLMSGAKNAQDMQLGQQQLALGEQTQKLNEMRIKEAQQAMVDKDALRGLPPDQYEAALIAQGKQQEALEYKRTNALYQNALLDNKSSLLDLNKKQREKVDRDNTINMTVFHNVLQETDPIKQQAMFKQYKAVLSKAYPDLVMPDEFNDNTARSVLRMNEVIQGSIKQEASKDLSDIKQTEVYLENLRQNKEKMKKEGRPTDDIDRQINGVLSKLDDLYKKQKETPGAKDPLVRLQEDRRALEDKVANGTATEQDKRDLMDINNKINKDSSKGVLGKVGDAVGNVVEGIGNMLTRKPSANTSSIPQGRVEVIAPDGTVGHIPANQLNDALKSGYKQAGK